MAKDNIAKLYKAFSDNVGGFDSEDEFREYIRTADSKKMGWLYKAFDDHVGGFENEDDFKSYVGWTDPADSFDPSAGFAEAEVSAMPENKGAARPVQAPQGPEAAQTQDPVTATPAAQTPTPQAVQDAPDPWVPEGETLPTPEEAEARLADQEARNAARLAAMTNDDSVPTYAKDMMANIDAQVRGFGAKTRLGVASAADTAARHRFGAQATMRPEERARQHFEQRTLDDYKALETFHEGLDEEGRNTDIDAIVEREFREGLPDNKPMGAGYGTMGESMLAMSQNSMQRMQREDYDRILGVVMDKYGGAARSAGMNAYSETLRRIYAGEDISDLVPRNMLVGQDVNGRPISMSSWDGAGDANSDPRFNIDLSGINTNSELARTLDPMGALDKRFQDWYGKLSDEERQALADKRHTELAEAARKKAEDEYKQAIEGQVQQKILELAAPGSDTEYLLNTIVGGNPITKINAGLARRGAGVGETTLQLRDQATAQYAEGRPWLQATGMAGQMLFDPTLYLAAPISGAFAARAVGWFGKAMYGGTAMIATAQAGRYATMTMPWMSRIVGGVAGGAANLGSYELMGNAVDQFRDGRFSVGEMLGAGWHGAKTGAALGVTGSVVGKLGEGVVGKVGNTYAATGKLTTGGVAKKVAADAGFKALGITAETGVFATMGLVDEGEPWTVENIMKHTANAFATVMVLKGQHMVTSGGKAVIDRATGEVPAQSKGIVKDWWKGYTDRLKDNKQMAFTKEDRRWLGAHGYGDLGRLFDVKDEDAKVIRVEDYDRLGALLKDKDVPLEITAKAYYMVTGVQMPMVTPGAVNTIVNRDAEGNVTSYTVEVRGKAEDEGDPASGRLISRREYKSQGAATHASYAATREMQKSQIAEQERNLGIMAMDYAYSAAIEEVAGKYGMSPEGLAQVFVTVRFADPEALKTAYGEDGVSKMRGIAKVIMSRAEKHAAEAERQSHKPIKEGIEKSQLGGGSLDEVMDKWIGDRTDGENTALGDYQRALKQAADDIVARRKAELENTPDLGEYPDHDVWVDAVGSVGHYAHDDGRLVAVKVASGEDERDGYVVRGKVVLNADGTLDRTRSDKELYVADLETGKVEMKTPEHILSVEEEDFDAAVREVYKSKGGKTGAKETGSAERSEETATETPAAAEPTGKAATEFGNGGYGEMEIDGERRAVAIGEVLPADYEEPALAGKREVLFIGEGDETREPLYMTDEELAGKVSNFEPEKTEKQKTEEQAAPVETSVKPVEGAPVETETPVETTTEAAPVETPAVEPPATPVETTATTTTEATPTGDAMPMVEVKKGGKTKQTPDWKTAGAGRSHQHLYQEKGLSKEEADAFVDGRISASEKAVKAAKDWEKKKPEASKYDDPDDYLEAKAKWEAGRDTEGKAEAELKLWQDVKAIETERRSALYEPIRQQEQAYNEAVENAAKEQAQASQEPQTVDEYVAAQLSGLNRKGATGITYESLVNELGESVAKEVRKKLPVGSVKSRANGGVSVAQLADNIWESMPRDIRAGLPDPDDSHYVRNLVIDALRGGEFGSWYKEKRERDVREAQDRVRREFDEGAYREHHTDSFEEYLDYSYMRADETISWGENYDAKSYDEMEGRYYDEMVARLEESKKNTNLADENKTIDNEFGQEHDTAGEGQDHGRGGELLPDARPADGRRVGEGAQRDARGETAHSGDGDGQAGAVPAEASRGGVASKAADILARVKGENPAQDSGERHSVLGGTEARVAEPRTKQEKALVDLAESFGRKVVFEDGENFHGSNDRGYIDKDGVIHINKDMSLPEQLSFVIGHEFAHTAEESAGYGEMMDAILGSKVFDEWLRDSETNTDELVSDKMQAYKDAGIPLDEQGAKREIVADFVSEKILQDPRNVRRIMAESPTTRGFLTRIADKLLEFFRRLAGKRPLTPREEEMRNIVEMFANNVRIANAELNDAARRVADIEGRRHSILGEKGAKALDNRDEATMRMDNLGVARRIEETFSKRDERLEKFNKATQVTIDSELVTRSTDIKEYQKNALDVGKKLRGRYINKDTGTEIEVNKSGLVEVTRHDRDVDAHMQSVAVIPEMIENGIYLGTLPNEDTKVRATAFDYYLCPMRINGVDYVAKMVVADRDGVKYYDHKLTEISRGNIRNLIKGTSTDAEGISSPASSTDALFDGKDKRLFQLLQISKKELAKKIKMATGWERGADGKWRYEVPDGKVESDFSNFTEHSTTNSYGDVIEYHTAKLGDVYHSEELYSAYPQLRDVEVVMYPFRSSSEGEYKSPGSIYPTGAITLWGCEHQKYEETPRGKEIKRRLSQIEEEDETLKKIAALDEQQSRLEDESKEYNAIDEEIGTLYDKFFSESPYAEEYKRLDDLRYKDGVGFKISKVNKINKSVIVHEVQHAIQHIEGFAEGGNVKTARDYIKKHRDSAVEAIERTLQERIDAAKPAWDEVKRINSLEWNDENWSEREAELAQAESEAKRHDETVERWRKFLDTAKRKAWSEISDEEAQEVYRNIAGEVEARNASTRMNFSEDERREKLLEETEDVAREDQIFLKNNLGESAFIGKRARAEYEALLDKKQPGMPKEWRDESLDYLHSLEDTKENNRKVKIAVKWLSEGKIRLPQDKDIVDKALKLADKKHIDPMGYASPADLLLDNTTLLANKEPLDPDTQKAFSGKRVDKKSGCVIYDVEDNERGQQAVIDILRSHLGKDENGNNIGSPWCLSTFTNTGKATESAKHYWKHYSGTSKKIAFKDGKVFAFSANDGRKRVWWDFDDETNYDSLSECKDRPEYYGKNATVVEYTQNGVTSRVVVHDDGKRVLSSRAYKKGDVDIEEQYHGNGQLSSREEYKDGKLNGTSESYYSNGQVGSRAEYKDDKLNGTRESYYSNGQLKSREEYKDDKLNGTSESYYENGQLKSRTEYKDGNRNGVGETYYENGQLKSRAEYTRDYGNGVTEEYYKNGQLKVRIEYLTGNLHGVWEEYHEDGKLRFRTKWRGGILEERGTDAPRTMTAAWEKADSRRHSVLTEESRRADAGHSIRYLLGDPAETFEDRRKAAVENRGTVMPGLADKEVKVVNVPRHGYKGDKPLTQAVESAKARYSGKTLSYDNHGQKFEYSITGGSLTYSANHASNSANIGVHVAVMDKLDSVIGESVEVMEHADSRKVGNERNEENGTNPDALMHRFVGAVKIDDTLYRVVTTMKEVKGSSKGKHHTYEVVDIETIEAPDKNLSRASNGSVTQDDSQVRVAKLLKETEIHNKSGEKILEESAKADRERSDDVRPAAIDKATETAKGLNTQVRVVKAADIKGANDAETRRMRNAKGWYDTRTGEVVLVEDNITSVEDAVTTVLHETVAHKGLRGLYGERFDKVLDDIYDNLDAEVRDAIDARVGRQVYDTMFDGPGRVSHEAARREATEEYLASLAEETNFEAMSQRPWFQRAWERIKSAVSGMLMRAGIRLPRKLTDNELRYMLWRSYNNLQRTRDMRVEAENRLKMDELGIGDRRFRDPGDADLPDTELGNAARTMRGAILHANHKAGGDYAGALAQVTNNILKVVKDMRTRRGTDKQWADAEAKAGRAAGKAARAQRTYDRATVQSVSDLARVLLETGYIDSPTQGEMKRLLSVVKNATGVDDLTEAVNKVIDIMVNTQLRRGEKSLDDLLKVKGSKVDARGVEVQGKLDIMGQRRVESMKRGMGMKADAIDEAMVDAMDRMTNGKTRVARDNAADEYAGLWMAKRYHDDIKGSEEAETAMEAEIKRLEEQKADGAIPAGIADASIESLRGAIRRNRVERAGAYDQLAGQLGDMERRSMAAAERFVERQKQHVGDIHHKANSDMEGRSAEIYVKPGKAAKFVNNGLVQGVFAPLATFEQMLRVFGNKAVNGEGYLWNHFARGWVDAREKFLNGRDEKMRMLDQKAADILDKDKARWTDLIELDRKLKPIEVEVWDPGAGAMMPKQLTQGNVMYIYMVNKMADGRMKLAKMGITEDVVDALAGKLDPRLREAADWLQEEFLPQIRDGYNETHKRLFGASMADIDDYFPLVINKRDITTKEADLDKKDLGGISTKTGAITKRVVNTKALDILNANAINVVVDHVYEMEQWNAFADWNNDLNILRTYGRFKNQVMNMTTVYGSGKVLWDKFEDACRLAAGTYEHKRGWGEAAAVNTTKLITASKIGLRTFTAYKQLLSFPAYFPDVSVGPLLRALENPESAIEWCMKNLPLYRERWNSRMAGDPRLVKTDVDWKMWRSKFAQTCSRVGMTPNAFIDAVTVGIGAHAVYKTRYERYLKEGYSMKEADRRAKQDATIAFNQSQQSSEGMFMSTLQADHTWFSTLVTVFRNASMSYTRQEFDALRNLGRKCFKKDYKKTSIDFMTKQYMRDGAFAVKPMTGEQIPDDVREAMCRRVATRKYYKSWARDAAKLAIFGFGLQYLWNLGPYAAYLLFGDDPEKKKEMERDARLHAMYGSVEGLTLGDVMSGVANNVHQFLADGRDLKSYALDKDIPLVTDVREIWTEICNGDYPQALNDLTNIIGASVTGINPATLEELVYAAIDWNHGDLDAAKESALFLMRVQQVPQSQIDNIYFDEIDLSGREAMSMSPKDLIERYATYKTMREAGPFKLLYSDEKLEKRMDSKRKKVRTLLKDKLANASDDDVNNLYNEGYDIRADYNKAIKAIKDDDSLSEVEKERREYAYYAEHMGDACVANFYMYFNSPLAESVRAFMDAEDPDLAKRIADWNVEYKRLLAQAVDLAKEYKGGGPESYPELNEVRLALVGMVRHKPWKNPPVNPSLELTDEDAGGKYEDKNVNDKYEDYYEDNEDN